MATEPPVEDQEMPDFVDQDASNDDDYREEDSDESEEGEDGDDEPLEEDVEEDVEEDATNDEEDDQAKELKEGKSAAGTDTDATAEPVKRKRGRPPGSGRKKKGQNQGGKSGRFQALQVPLDENGVPYKVENDELVLPEDPAGEAKIDKLGFLQDGREFRVRTFTVLGRGERQYMLATEPARCIGFRDSYLLFQRHRMLLKIKLNDDEKFDLISREILPHSYKGRTIGIVTARSIFREFGARLIVGGKHVVDDYYEAKAKEAGLNPEELADPSDVLPPAGEEYNRNQYVAWHSSQAQFEGNSAALYQSNLKSVLQAAADAPSTATEEVAASPVDPAYFSESTKAASSYNAELTARRRQLLKRSINDAGIIEPHTSVRFAPLKTQPTRARMSKISNKASRGAVEITTVMDWSRPSSQPHLSKLDPSVWEAVDPQTKKAILDQIEQEKKAEIRA